MTWMEVINRDFRELGICREDATDRARWKRLIGPVNIAVGWLMKVWYRLTQVDLDMCRQLHVVLFVVMYNTIIQPNVSFLACINVHIIAYHISWSFHFLSFTMSYQGL